MEIVDADIRDLQRKRPRRSRSPQMAQLIEVVQALRSGDAKALVAERGEKVTTLRSRLGVASRVTGVKLRTVTDGKRVLFTRSGRASSKAGAIARRDAIQAKALQLAKKGQSVSAEDVVGALAADGNPLDVARPATAVGAVLRRMDEFKRVGQNRFQRG